ncbi:MAG: 3-hydroxyacyl-CoA dehydrogenase family protein [Promethearchaeota archaeon]
MDVNEIQKIGIVGAGVMGPGIAEVFAIFGASFDFEIIIYDISQNALKEAESRIQSDMKRVESTGLYSAEDLKIARKRINLETEIDAIADSQLVIEVIPEKLDLKRALFKELDKLTSPSTILATNSSGLSITDIADVTTRPKLCIGTHFMNPPLLMPLVEVVKGQQTADETVQTLMTLLTSVNKRPVLVKKDIPGYVHNRLQAALFREAMYLLEEEVMEIPDLETTVRYGLGLRLPIIKVFESVDLMGLDTIQNVLAYLYPNLNRSTDPPAVIKKMINEGKLGVKSGMGFHDYSQKDMQESLNEKQAAMFQLLMLMMQYD